MAGVVLVHRHTVFLRPEEAAVTVLQVSGNLRAKTPENRAALEIAPRLESQGLIRHTCCTPHACCYRSSSVTHADTRAAVSADCQQALPPASSVKLGPPYSTCSVHHLHTPIKPDLKPPLRYHLRSPSL